MEKQVTAILDGSGLGAARRSNLRSEPIESTRAGTDIYAGGSGVGPGAVGSTEFGAVLSHFLDLARLRLLGCSGVVDCVPNDEAPRLPGNDRDTLSGGYFADATRVYECVGVLCGSSSMIPFEAKKTRLNH